ncbi:MAG TPA: hypothetical protein VEF36_03255 [Roseiarcus sp.]|nr:hypothetical protein [Roseiarcus sp.]
MKPPSLPQAPAQAAPVWRPLLQNLEYEAIALPREIESKILALMKIFGLVYGPALSS